MIVVIDPGSPAGDEAVATNFKVVDGTLVIEAVSKLICSHERHKLNSRMDGPGARVIPMSLPRVRCLEKPE